MNYQKYINFSLELHLFFDRILKEHSFFIEASLTEKDKELKKVANNFQKSFSNILKEAITLADGNISKIFLTSNEFVTNNTLLAEKQTASASGIQIDKEITLAEINLKSGSINLSEQLINDISRLNRKTLPLINNLILFKSDILNKVLTCKLYTTNYPLLITHIMNEAKMYLNLLTKVENREPISLNYIYEQELFWNNIMKEHAEFIRGLLDPSEKKLIFMANEYAKNYEKLLNNYGKNYEALTNASLQQTIDFKKFKLAGEEGILQCKIKSIILPLLADHILREANHFIRILKSAAL